MICKNCEEQCRLDGKMYDANCLNDKFKKAIKLALQFKQFCIENDIPVAAEIAGVAWNTPWIREQAYIEGQKFEKQRIATQLGLNI